MANQLYLRKAGDTATGAIVFDGGLFVTRSPSLLCILNSLMAHSNLRLTSHYHRGLIQRQYCSQCRRTNWHILTGSGSISTNSLVITANTLPPNTSCGITNVYNSGRYTSRFGSDANNYATLTINFNDSGGLAIDDALLFEFQCAFWNNDQPADDWGQTTGEIMVFPAQFFSQMSNPYSDIHLQH